MRKIRHHARRGLIAAAFAAMQGGTALAQSSDPSALGLYPPYIPPSQSSVYNQNSMYLPTPPIVHGTDMVRGTSGVSCQSAVGSGGPYLDIGVIGSQDVYSRDTASVYGRVVVPLGGRPKRPDCTKLYELEIARMQMELDLLRMGLPPGIGSAAIMAPASPESGPPPGEALMIDPASAPAGAHNQRPHQTSALDGFTPIFRLAPSPSLKPDEKTAQFAVTRTR